ncbi:sensor histidine kinase [Paraoerskovia marina]|uniref:sensor histidine kinase n=1 Tax=Paraoerskovia marina TaxID=545619 RepID=UPI0006936286|nr:histidine kinase [Paraoerskovia marina]
MTSTTPEPVPPGVPAPASPLTELDARNLGPVRRWFAVHPVGTDRVVVGLYLAATALALAVTDVPAARWWVAAASFVVAALLLRRRTHPVGVTVAVSVIGAIGILTLGDTAAFDLAAAFGVYTVASNRPAHDAWSTAGVAIVMVAGAALIASPSATYDDGLRIPADVPLGTITADRVVTAVFVVVVILIALSIGSTVHSRRLHIADLLDRANGFAREAEQSAQIAAAAERGRIAREMHDVVAHSLTVMVALADGAKALGPKDPELARQALDELTETGRTALTDMRSVLGVLRAPESGTENELATGAPDLDDVVATFRTAGLPVRLVREGGAANLPVPTRRAVERIVTEALTNVLRHAPLSPDVRVSLGGVWNPDGPGRSVEIVVLNTHGPGQSKSTSGAQQGIIGMRERATALGGTIEAGPYGSGWRVRALLPLKEEM